MRKVCDEGCVHVRKVCDEGCVHVRKVCGEGVHDEGCICDVSVCICTTSIEIILQLAGYHPSHPIELLL